MYEEIRKPRLLKDIPLMLIRALPPLYYYTKYNRGYAPERVERLFKSHVRFLTVILQKIGERLENDSFLKISSLCNKMELNPTEGKVLLNDLTVQMSDICRKNRDQLRLLIREIKPELINSYKSIVSALKIAIVEDDKADLVKKLENTLCSFCFYEVVKLDWKGSETISVISDSDVVLFASTASPRIHDQVRALHTYKKPGLAASFLDEDRELSLRHGAQLLKIGFPVLFKIFTPIRLFTSVDKVFIKYHLQ